MFGVSVMFCLCFVKFLKCLVLCVCSVETLRLEPKLLVTRWRHLWAVALNLSSCAYLVLHTKTQIRTTDSKKKIL